mmetsp:Transcript_38329/g.105581  ORF Transcript_38329/g.105581 Transcript_38329/m.105581 type:complete len:384 (+) Transcript_38329:52-1203(+)
MACKRSADGPSRDPRTLHGGDPAAARLMAAAAAAAGPADEIRATKKIRSNSVPIIDVAPFFADPGSEEGRNSVCNAIARACEEVGFFVITGHQIDDLVIQACAKEARTFFAKTLKEKMEVAAGGRAYGFFPMDSEALGYNADVSKRPDLREAFSIGPQHPLPPPSCLDAPEASEVADFVYQATPWPSDGGMRDAMTRYYDALGQLANGLLKIFARILAVDAELFLSKVSHHGSSLRAIHYPRLEVEPLPGQMRCGEHSDICTMTILWQDVQGGLEVLPRGHEEWLEVVCPEDGLIVNLGDLFARWTNDRWLSTPHRVVPPRLDDSVRNVPRISMPYFQILNSDAVVRCIETCLREGEEPKHAPTTQGQHLMSHFKRWGRNRSD